MASNPTPPAERWACSFDGKTMCAVCGAWTPLLRPVDAVTCRSCGAIETLSPEQWRGMLAPAVARARVWERVTGDVTFDSDRSGPEGPLGERLELWIARVHPPCPACLEPVDEAGFEARRCGRCRAELPVEAPPRWLAGAVPRLAALMPDPAAGVLPVGGVEGRHVGRTEGAVVGCPQCKANLELRVGVGALVKCTHCGASVVVPDEVRAALSVDPWDTGQQVPAGRWWALLRIDPAEERAFAARTAEAVAAAMRLARELGWEETRTVDELLALEPEEEDEDDEDEDEDDEDDEDDEEGDEGEGMRTSDWAVLGGCGAVFGGLVLAVLTLGLLAAVFGGLALGLLL